MAKTQKPIAEGDVSCVFDDACVRILAKRGKLPATADFHRFAEGLRDAARIYARDARKPSDNELYAEIEALHRAAERQDVSATAALIEGLSSRAREHLETRGPRSKSQPKLPSPSKFHDRAGSTAACASVVRLTQTGGKYVQGRRRPNGKCSRPVWEPSLYAPSRQRNFPRRDAERNFLIFLQAAWIDATSSFPSKSANHFNPGPFARMVKDALCLVGARADAVELINEISKRRKEVKARALSPIKP